MKRRIIKGIAAALCIAAVMPGAVSASGMSTSGGLYNRLEELGPDSDEDDNEDNDDDDDNSGSLITSTKTLEEAKADAKKILRDYKIFLDPDEEEAKEINKILGEAFEAIDKLSTVEGVNDYVDKTKEEMRAVTNPPSDDKGDDNEEEIPADADHFLMVGGSWVTPTASAGKEISIVLPVVNMGKTMVTDAVVTPVLSTSTTEWPFEITNSNYSQTIADLPGTDSGMSDMDRRRELTWNLKTRSDVGSGYQKISFEVRYRASDGSSQEATLDTYVQLNGTAGVGADGQSSVPRVIVTGFETNPETVHAGESFMLTLHLKNTSTATSVSNMIFEILAAVEGKDEDTTYAAFLPTAGSSTIFVNRIEKNGTKDIEIELEAKADLSQKPYAVDVNMSYEDEHVNSYTNKTSVSIPVKQEARVDISEPEVMPASIEVGSESNIMFNIYNMGKRKLYNVQVKLESDTVSGGDSFVGNIDSGATGSVDMYVTGQSATMDDGTVKLLISYEDETGEATVIERKISLFVNEAMARDPMMDDTMPDQMEGDGGTGGGTSRYVLIGAGALILAAVGVLLIVLRRRRKKEQKRLEEDLLDLEEGADDENS